MISMLVASIWLLHALPVAWADVLPPVLWIADQQGLKRIDPITRQITASLSFNREVQTLTVNPRDNSLWTFADRQLFKFDASGNLAQTIDLKTIVRGLGEPKAMALDPYDGSLWVSGEKTLLHLTPGGQLLSVWSAPDHIQAFILDTDESLWMLVPKKLLHLSAHGILLASYTLSSSVEEAKLLAVDELSGNLWIASGRTLLQLTLTDLTQPPRVIRLPSAPTYATDDGPDDMEEAGGAITALTTDPLSGRLWVTTKGQLNLIDPSGAILQTIDLRALSLHHIKKLAFEPLSMNFWLGGKQALGQFDNNGQFMGAVSVDNKVKAIGVAPLALSPTVSLLAPPDGVLTNNSRPTLRLGLGAYCNGVACSVGGAYFDSLSLVATLNSQDLSKLFNVTAGIASYQPPTRLPEGINTVTAQAQDRFGHRSDQLTAHFTIDTIPPKFLSISPANGSTLSTSAIMIQGTLDDSTASVLLLDATGNVLSMASGASFSFLVTLKPGPNGFMLVARDPAGNATSVPLALNFSSVLNVMVTSITSGAMVSTDNLLLSGKFGGPENTGVTVNGVVAVTADGKFYVNNLPLQPGTNTLTVIATTPDGQTVTQTLTVINTGLSPFQVTVEPQSGVAPLNVAFTVTAQTSNTIQQIAIDFDGNGTTDFTTTDPTAPITFTYNTPGVYQPRITITDNQGATYNQSLAVVVYSAVQMDKLFETLWTNMNNALQSGDITGASRFLNASAKLKYKPLFDALLSRMSQILASYSSLRRISISENIGEYAINRTYLGQNRIYLIYFLRDSDGVWRLDAM